ncbi:MAG: hypothetical protein K5662_06430 [Lachnospiraceae bacterium]|nr:hypothetical protein [Lachnospiraceae bacterium]
MTAAEGIILVIGIVLFVISFIIPSRKEGDGVVDKAAAEKAAKDAVARELSKFRNDIQESGEDSINENRDKMERMLDRLTNEKMMAINEYSDTVLEQIHKDHEEAMFLYDMLNNKQAQVKNTAAELGEIEKRVNATVKNAESAATEAQPVKTSATQVVQSEDTSGAADSSNTSASADGVGDQEQAKAKKGTGASKSRRKSEDKTKEKVFEAFNPERVEINKEIPVGVTYDSTPVEMMFQPIDTGVNNNEKIMELHKAGKSKMAIAKELGLGVGEVQLVLDINKAQGV